VGELIDQLDTLLTGIDRQDTQVLDAAARIDGFARDTSALLADARGDVRTDLQQLYVSARGINRNSRTLEQVLARLPRHYAMLQDSASYGNFFNFFLCGVRVQTDLGTGPWMQSGAARCGR